MLAEPLRQSAPIAATLQKRISVEVVQLARAALDEIANTEAQRRALIQSELDADAEAAHQTAARHLRSLESQKS